MTPTGPARRRRIWPATCAFLAGLALGLLAGNSCAQAGSAVNVPAADRTDEPREAVIVDPSRNVWSPQILQSVKRPPTAPAPGNPDERPGVLQTGQLDDWPRLFRDDRWLFTGSVSATLALYKMWGNLFGPPAPLAWQGFRSDPGWGEFFVEPGFTVSYQPSPSTRFYAGAAYLQSGTRNVDYAGIGYTNHGDMEDLYAGVHWSESASGIAVDVSYGQQDFMVGNGMLLASGATNGVQRGASFVAPRHAWAAAGLFKISRNSFTATAFYLRPNEAAALLTGTRLAGANVEWNPAGPLRLGAMYLRVPESNITTRKDLEIYDMRARWQLRNASPSVWVEGEYVWQRKPQVAAAGWYVQGNYHAVDVAWKPLVAVRYASLSGDRPETTQWEGFDPLYFGNGYPNWYQGQIISTFLANTNLDTASVSLTLTPAEKVTIDLGFLHFSANRTNSPLVIPAVNTAPMPGGGVPRKPLANEFDATCTYTFNQRVNIGALVAYASPGAGYQQLYSTNGGSATGWWFIGTQFNLTY